MTPAGRPPRSSSSSKKTISVRVTEEEYARLLRGADPANLSDWARRVLLDSYDVRKHDEPPKEARNLVQVFADLKAEAQRVAATLEEKKQPRLAELTLELHKAMVDFLTANKRMVDDMAEQLQRATEAGERLHAKLYPNGYHATKED